MTLLVKILIIAGWILLGLAAFVLLLLCIPAVVDIRYAHRALVIRIRYGFIRLKVVDTGEKKETQPDEEPSEQEPEPQQEDEKKGGLDLKMILRLVEPGFKALRGIVRSLKIRDVRVVLVASGEEPDEIGIGAGRRWAALGAMLAVVNNIWDDVEYKELAVIPDFTDRHREDEEIGGAIRAMPIVIVCIGIVLFFRYLRIKRQRKKEKIQKEREIRAIKETAS